MGILKNQRHERFAQELASGINATDAHEKAGFKRNPGNACTLKSNKSVIKRIAEINNERAAIHAQAVAQAVKTTGLSKEWVIRTLIQNVERSMQVEEVTRYGKKVGEFVYNGHVANKALELLGREIGMFIERHEVGGAGDFARLTDEELLQKALTDARAAGAGPAELAAIRVMFDPRRLIEGEVVKEAVTEPGESDEAAE